jgi:hypothetical protein
MFISLKPQKSGHYVTGQLIKIHWKNVLIIEVIHGSYMR